MKNLLEILDTTEGFIAVYTGTTGEGEEVVEEEAHNLRGASKEDREAEALTIWGVDRDTVEITHL